MTVWFVCDVGTFVLARKWLHRVQVWLQSSHLPARRSDFRASTKVQYHMTFDLDLDLEHTLDAGLPVDHRVQVWSQSSHLPARKSDISSRTKVPSPYHVTFDLDLDHEHILDAG